MHFYDNFIKLCNAKGEFPSTVTTNIGLDKSAATNWKNGSVPRSSTILKLADYFNVDPTIFMLEDLTRTSNNAEVLTTQTERELLTSWRKATYEQQENIAFILREYGFKYERPLKKEEVI